MPPRYLDIAVRRRRAVIDIPHVVNWYFRHRVDTLMRFFFESALDAEWRWYRFEYQDRGNIHPHGTVKLKNDPGLVELTAAAYKRVCGVVTYEKKQNDFLGSDCNGGAVEWFEGVESEVQQLEELISKGRVAEKILGRYADWLVSTMNTRAREEQDLAPGDVPDPHCSSVNSLREGPFEDVSAATVDVDGVFSCIQGHKGRPEGYYKRKTNAGTGAAAVIKCRFDYPYAECEETRLEFTELDSGDVKANLVARRNEGNMNSHNQVLRQNWRVNVDIQLLQGWEDAVLYIIKYVSKQEKRSQSKHDRFNLTVCRDGENDPVGTETSLRRVFLKAVSE